jgi:hypothetical protein
MDKPTDRRKDADRAAREAAEADRRRTDSGAHEAEESAKRDSESLIEEEDHSMEALRHDDK